MPTNLLEASQFNGLRYHIINFADSRDADIRKYLDVDERYEYTNHELARYFGYFIQSQRTYEEKRAHYDNTLGQWTYDDRMDHYNNTLGANKQYKEATGKAYMTYQYRRVIHDSYAMKQGHFCWFARVTVIGNTESRQIKGIHRKYAAQAAWDVDLLIDEYNLDIQKNFASKSQYEAALLVFTQTSPSSHFWNDAIASKLAIGEGRQDDLEQERQELLAMNSESFRHAFIEKNRPWVLSHLVELIILDVLQNVGSDGRPVIDYLRDIYSTLMNDGEGVNRRSDDQSDISSGDYSDDEEEKRRQWDRTPLEGNKLLIAQIWIHKEGRKIK
jgi:hypothetical protein